MIRRIAFTGAFLALALVFVVALAPTRVRNRLLGSVGGGALVLPARPATTPFDQTDVSRAAHYRETYARGYEWAWGRHSRCPPSIWAAGWATEAWLEGFADGRVDGGKGDLPERFRPQGPEPPDEVPQPFTE